MFTYVCLAVRGVGRILSEGQRVLFLQVPHEHVS